jgi:hypothetical protein
MNTLGITRRRSNVFTATSKAFLERPWMDAIIADSQGHSTRSTQSVNCYEFFCVSTLFQGKPTSDFVSLKEGKDNLKVRPLQHDLLQSFENRRLILKVCPLQQYLRSYRPDLACVIGHSLENLRRPQGSSLLPPQKPRAHKPLHHVLGTKN